MKWESTIRRLIIVIAICALIEAIVHWKDFSIARFLAMIMIYCTVKILSDMQRNPDYGLRD